MRKSFSHKLILFGLLLLSLQGMATTAYAKKTGSSTQHTKTQQFSDATEMHGEFEISVLHTSTAASHRTLTRNGPGQDGFSTNNTFIPANTKNRILCKSAEPVHSRHLVLIFPFHYFW